MDTVGVSVVFSDLVGSTALSARVGAEAAEEIRHAHFGVLRSATEAHGGREVKNLGDGIMAVFSGAAAALDAATAMQQGIARHNRSGDGLPLVIRVGVATGDCTEEDGDYFGEPVVQAARLCDLAQSDEILATGVFRYLVPRDKYGLDDELELKGLPDLVPTVRGAVEPSRRPADRRAAAAGQAHRRAGRDHGGPGGRAAHPRRRTQVGSGRRPARGADHR